MTVRFVTVLLLLSLPSLLIRAAGTITSDTTHIQKKSVSEVPAQDTATIAPKKTFKPFMRRDSTIVFFFYNDFEKFGHLNTHSFDTTLAGFQNYDALAKQGGFFENLGNIGSIYNSLIPYPFMRPSGWDFGIHTFDQFLYLNDSVKYYKVFKTFTEVSYFQGPKKENTFHAIFSRNLYKSLNLGFDFRVNNAPGAYLRQRTNDINFALTLQYFTKDKRYGFIANFIFNRLRNYENGGIIADSVFEKNTEKNRQVIDVNLQAAQNRMKESGFYTKHYFNLSRHAKNEKDTAFLNSSHFDLGRLTYSFGFNRQVQNYMDTRPPDSGFYQNIYHDSINTRDSITIDRIVNELTWSNPTFNKDRKLRLLQIEAGIKQQYIHLSYRDSVLFVHRYFIQYIPKVALYFHPFSSLLIEAHGDYVLGDNNQGDFSLRVNLSTILGRQDKNAGTATLSGIYSYQQPGWYFGHYTSNNFKWDTTFNKQGLISGGFDYRFKFLNAGFNFNRITNYVYLDSNAHPQQFKNEFGYIYIYFNTDVSLWRFRIKTKLVYQTIQGTNVLRLPAFMGNLSVYYSQPLFNGAAVLQPGLSFNYNTSYYADGYMPALRSYYLQNQKETGNYLYMDVFINLKIQRARFFVSYTNWGSFFEGRTYWAAPHYPNQDASFRFGVSWRFHD
jgi:Putative porin